MTARQSHAQKQQQASKQQRRTLTHTQSSGTKGDGTLWQQKQNVPLGRSSVLSWFSFSLFGFNAPAVLAASCGAEVSFSDSGAMSETQKSAQDLRRQIANVPNAHTQTLIRTLHSRRCTASKANERLNW